MFMILMKVLYASTLVKADLNGVSDFAVLKKGSVTFWIEKIIEGLVSWKKLVLLYKKIHYTVMFLFHILHYIEFSAIFFFLYSLK